jgi:pyruvate formate lyase activating enzyme
MILKGLQKTTLLDYPGKLACTVFTGGCNFRCPFCHNAALVERPSAVDDVSTEAFFKYITKRSSLLDGVCITGGEPLLNPDIVDFIKRIRALGLLVKLDTNGSFPDRLEALLDSGLIDYVAMDVKNSPEKYAKTIGLDDSYDLSPIMRSIEIIMKKAPDYEFRTTVVRELHDEEDIKEIAALLSGTKRYYLQKYVDSGDILCQGYSAYDDSQMQKLQAICSDILPVTILRGV